MENNKLNLGSTQESKELAVHYMKTLVDVAREAFLILDANLRVISGNPIFYKNFQVSEKETENMLFYKLGNGQWNIPELKKLLEEVLPQKKDVRDYEVTHIFEKIGTKTILLNAKQIDSVQLIILAMEDITAKNQLEQKLSEYTKNLEIKLIARTKQLTARVKELEELNQNKAGREIKMEKLEKEINELKKK